MPVPGDAPDRLRPAANRIADQHPALLRAILRSGAATVVALGFTIGFAGEAAASDPLLSSSDDLTDPVTEMSTESTDTVAPALAPVINTLEPGTAPVVEIVEPAVEPVAATLEPVVNSVEMAPAAEILAPVVAAATETLEPVARTVGAIVEPVVDGVEPVLDPVLATTASVTDPLVSILASVADALAPTVGTLDGAVAPLTQPLAPVMDALVTPLEDLTATSRSAASLAELRAMLVDVPVADSAVSPSKALKAPVLRDVDVSAPSAPGVSVFAEPPGSPMRPGASAPLHTTPTIVTTTLHGAGAGAFDWTPVALLGTLLLLTVISRALSTMAHARPPIFAALVPVPPG